MSREAHMYILPRVYITIKNEMLMEKSRITSFQPEKDLWYLTLLSCRITGTVLNKTITF